MLQVTTYALDQIPNEKLKFAVIAAKYRGNWIFCRHKKRQTWELPGGHREMSEKIDDCARRELFEETGVTQCNIQPVRVYSVASEGEISYGMLFYADVAELGILPADSEIGETRLCACIPKELTYPNIQNYLFEWIQAWLNLQSNPGELWDVYDCNRRLIGRTHRRGEPMHHGDYHLVVHVWIRNAKGQYLLTKRAPNKGFPNMWECSGGSALAGDDSLTAALREVKEETGIALDPNSGVCLLPIPREDNFCDVWLFQHEVELSKVVLQPGETTDAMLADEEEIRRMY